MSIQLTGISQFMSFLTSLEDMHTVVGSALFNEAQPIMTASKQQCPVDTGALRATGNVEKPEFHGDSVTVRLTYGGAAAPYAIYVHENVSAHHPVGNAKFLEVPLRAAIPGLVNGMTERIKQKLTKT